MIKWMGRYRNLIEALVRHSNVTARFSLVQNEIYDGISVDTQEWQLMEYIFEHDNEYLPMSQISERLGIAQSTFSKKANHLIQLGLLDKYQMVGNKKNIILRISNKGREVYNSYSETLSNGVWNDFFNELEAVPQDALNDVTKAIEIINCALERKTELNEGKKEVVLVKKDANMHGATGDDGS